MRKYTGYALGAAVLAATAGFTVSQVDRTDRPDCPTEDSCIADYRDGGWYVIENPGDRIECDVFEFERVCVDGETGEVAEGVRVTD